MSALSPLTVDGFPAPRHFRPTVLDDVRRSTCARHATQDVRKIIWPVRVLSVQRSAASAGCKPALLDAQEIESGTMRF